MPRHRLVLLTVLAVLASAFTGLVLNPGSKPVSVVQAQTEPEARPEPEQREPEEPRPEKQAAPAPRPTAPAIVTEPEPAPAVTPAPPVTPPEPARPRQAESGVRLTRLVTTPRAPTTRRTYLLAGVTPQYGRGGARGAETFRSATDTLMVVQLDPVANTVRTLSLPRDTYVTLPGRGGAKLNSALPTLGPDGLVRTVETLTGLRVDAYVLINLGGVRELTDAVGGVTVDVKRAMHYDDNAADLHIHIPAGRHRLDGERAEHYVRFRSDPLGDIGRAGRQQEFVRALVAQAFTPIGLTRLPRLADAVAGSTRATLSAEDYQHLMAFAVARPTLETHLLPGRFWNAGGASYWAVDSAQAGSLLAEFGSRPH